MIFFKHLKLVGGSLAALTISMSAHSPALAEGKPTRGSGIKPDVLYHNYCSVCHGDRGDGNSRAINSLNPPPRNFLQLDAPSLGREHMIEVIANGKPGTAMVGWGTQLNRKEIEGVADYIRDQFMKPALDPRVQDGKRIYDSICADCHGKRGEGVFNPAMVKQPKNFASPQSRVELYRTGMIEAVTNGRSGTYMISYRDRLKPAEIENVVDYIDRILMVPATQISGTRAHGGREADSAGKAAPSSAKADMNAPFPNGLKGDANKGKSFFNANCAECHGVKGDGQGPRAYFINPRPANFTRPQMRERLNRPALFIFVGQGKLGTEMPAWNKVLSDQEIADVAEYTFQAFIKPQKN